MREQPWQTTDLSKHKIDTLAETDEVHVYSVYPMSGGREVLLELDLVGTRLSAESNGMIPPVVHLECPACTTKEDRTAISITQENKGFEVEDLSPDKWRYWAIGVDGQVFPLSGGAPEAAQAKARGLRICINKLRLTVKEQFGCPYCGTRFSLVDNVLQRVWGGNGPGIVCSGEGPA